MITNIKENDIIICVRPYTVYDDYDLFLKPLIVKEIIHEPHDSYIKQVVLQSVKTYHKYHKPLYGHFSMTDTHYLSFSDIQDNFKKINLEEIL